MIEPNTSNAPLYEWERKVERRRSHAKKKEDEDSRSSSDNSKHSSKKKGHHHRHHHDKDSHSHSSKEKSSDEERSQASSSKHHKHHESTDQKDPDYHWENHEKTSVNSPKSKRHSSKRNSTKRLSVLVDGEIVDDVFDIVLDNEEDDQEEAPLESSHEVRTTQGNLSSDRLQQQEEEEEELDEEELDMAEDQALQTSPTHRRSILADSSLTCSPRAVISHHDNGLKCSHLNLSPPIRIESPKSRRSLTSLNSPILGMGHANPSFIPPFLVETNEDDDEDDEEEELEDISRDLSKAYQHVHHHPHHHQLGASVSSTSSAEWEWPTMVVPEAVGLDEGIPEINQERVSSLL